MKITAWLAYRPTLCVTCHGEWYTFVSSFNLLSLSMYKWLVPYLLLKNFNGQNLTNDLHVTTLSFVFWVGLSINNNPRGRANRQGKLLVLRYSGLQNMLASSYLAGCYKLLSFQDLYILGKALTLVISLSPKMGANMFLKTYLTAGPAFICFMRSKPVFLTTSRKTLHHNWQNGFDTQDYCKLL